MARAEVPYNLTSSFDGSLARKKAHELYLLQQEIALQMESVADGVLEGTGLAIRESDFYSSRRWYQHFLPRSQVRKETRLELDLSGPISAEIHPDLFGIQFAHITGRNTTDDLAAAVGLKTADTLSVIGVSTEDGLQEMCHRWNVESIFRAWPHEAEFASKHEITPVTDYLIDGEGRFVKLINLPFADRGRIRAVLARKAQPANPYFDIYKVVSPMSESDFHLVEATMLATREKLKAR